MKFFVVFALCAANAQAFIPERTQQREKLFFGIDSPPPPVSGSSEVPGRLPPANSQIGVNKTATNDRDFNDFGALGIPQELIDKRVEDAKAKAEMLGTVVPAKLLLYQTGARSSTGLSTVKHVLDLVSVMWLVGLCVGCYYFLRHALNNANRKVYFHAAKDKIEARHNARIDRESYVYVDGG